jgi:hypothetical protein
MPGTGNLPPQGGPAAQSIPALGLQEKSRKLVGASMRGLEMALGLGGFPAGTKEHSEILGAIQRLAKHFGQDDRNERNEAMAKLLSRPQAGPPGGGAPPGGAPGPMPQPSPGPIPRMSGANM